MPRNTRQQRLRLLRRAFERLSPELRRILIMSRVEKLGHVEIAERLSLDAAQTERMLARGLAELDRLVARMERPWWRRLWPF